MNLGIVFKNGREVVQTSTEGKWFEVNPLGIDRSLFEKPISDEKQEWVRQIILKAFIELDKHPEKYSSTFYTQFAEKDEYGRKIETQDECMEYANYLGGRLADWVEEALQWAQRFTNGETWEDVNDNDDAINGWYEWILEYRKNYKYYVCHYRNERYFPKKSIDMPEFNLDILLNLLSNSSYIFVIPLVVIK